MLARWRGSHLKCKLRQVQDREEGRQEVRCPDVDTTWTVFTLPGYTQHGGKVNWDGEYSGGNCSGFNHALICLALTRHIRQ